MKCWLFFITNSQQTQKQKLLLLAGDGHFDLIHVYIFEAEKVAHKYKWPSEVKRPSPIYKAQIVLNCYFEHDFNGLHSNRRYGRKKR